MKMVSVLYVRVEIRRGRSRRRKRRIKADNFLLAFFFLAIFFSFFFWKLNNFSTVGYFTSDWTLHLLNPHPLPFQSPSFSISFTSSHSLISPFHAAFLFIAFLLVWSRYMFPWCCSNNNNNVKNKSRAILLLHLVQPQTSAATYFPLGIFWGNWPLIDFFNGLNWAVILITYTKKSQNSALGYSNDTSAFGVLAAIKQERFARFCRD